MGGVINPLAEAIKWWGGLINSLKEQLSHGERG